MPDYPPGHGTEASRNLIPCSKATSPAYYALVRKLFPELFWRMAKLCRAKGAKLARLHGERIYIDEIPPDYPITQFAGRRPFSLRSDPRETP